MRFLSLAAACLVVGCASDYGSGPKQTTNTNATYDVYLEATTFSPAFGLIIAPNDTILWHFSAGGDGQGHNIRFTTKIAGVPADLPVQKSGTARSVFTTKGEFNFSCDVHPGMDGGLTVQ
jgi:plastocyanin